MPGWRPPPWTVRIRLRSESSNHRPRLRGRSFFPTCSMPVCTGTRRGRPADRSRLQIDWRVACLVILTGTLTGCGTYSAYRKCGSGGCPGDAKITAEVRALLNQHPALGPPNQVYVQTLDGVVYLTGQVATDLQRDSAEAVAHEASGVSRLMNTIALTYAGR